jgi:hypothetical protein
MPYPFIFRPNTTCILNDGRGSQQATAPLQLFRPFLGCNFDGPQPRIASRDVPQIAAGILRGLVQVAAAPALVLKTGPQWWVAAQPPYVVLNEDPQSIKWYWLDAIPYVTDPGPPTRLYSFWAASTYNSVPPPAPLVMGPNGPGAALVTAGVVYQSTLLAGASGWIYKPTATGVASVVSLVSQTTIAPIGINEYGGPHAAPVPETFIVGVAPQMLNTPGLAHTGPDGTVQLANTDLLNPTTLTYSFT